MAFGCYGKRQAQNIDCRISQELLKKNSKFLGLHEKFNVVLTYHHRGFAIVKALEQTCMGQGAAESAVIVFRCVKTRPPRNAHSRELVLGFAEPVGTRGQIDKVHRNFICAGRGRGEFS